MKHDRKSLALTDRMFVLWLLLGILAATIPLRASQSPGNAPERLTATIQSVDAKARTLYLLTGVGHALRGVYMHVPPACEIKVAGAKAELRALRPGQIVRIQYQRTAEDNVAHTIETVSPDKTQGRQ